MQHTKMSYIMANYTNIIIILLTIIFIKSTKQTMAHSNKVMKDKGDELYENFTAIEFLKDYQRFKQTNDNVLIMNNQNTSIASVFYTNSINGLDDNSTSAAATKIAPTTASGILSEKLTSASTSSLSLTFAAHLMHSLQVPIVQLNELQSFYLKRHLGEHLLSIVYIDIKIDDIQTTLNDHKGLLQKLSLNLLHITTTKVLFFINFPLTMTGVGKEDIIRGVILKLFQYCWQHKIINVIALFADYQTTKIYYSYTHFPVFQLEIKSIAQYQEKPEEIYPYRLGNLYGYRLPIAIGGSSPRIIPLKKTKGQLTFGGFVGHFLEAFAKKYNCRLFEPLPFQAGKPTPAQDLIKVVRNSTVEISAAITFPEIPMKGYTYGYEQMNWCIMLPVQPNVPGYKFFTLVFKEEIFFLVIASLVVISMLLSAALYIHGYRPDLLDIICHDDCLRGILGQSFSEITNPPKIVRFIYLQICILGILLTTAYNGYYSTYVTSAPKASTMNTFDDILLSGLKVVAWEPEYNELLGRVAEFKKYASFFNLEKSYQKYLQMRDSFNTKFGYIVPTTKWTIINEQQKVFTSALFTQMPNLCFFNNIPMCFPVHENSIFISLIYHLILETAQSGLKNYWREYGFQELIMTGKLRLVDLSTKKEFVPMKVDDLQYIFLFLGSMLILVILVFLIEILVFYRIQIFSRLRKSFCLGKSGKGGTIVIRNDLGIRKHNYNKIQFKRLN